MRQPSKKKDYFGGMQIAIIGNGISGITAARHLRKHSNHDITVISSETDYFFSRTALMYIYMGHMRFEDTKPYEDGFWPKNRISLKRARVEKIDFADKFLILEDGSNFSYDVLILATGSASNKFGWPGQDLPGVGSLYSYQDLQVMENYSKNLKRAVIVGGGLIGIEMAEMFHSRNIPVTMLVRESSYWNNILPVEESQMISQHIRDHHIDLRLGVNLDRILPDDFGRAGSVIIQETGEEIECGFVGLTAGVHPNIEFLKESVIQVERGILVDEYLRTNMPDVYAIGDCAQLRSPVVGRRPIEAVWYTGRMMGETVAKTVCGSLTKYDPGIWFNSAKFVDIEYQVYGDVRVNPPENHKSLLWQIKEKSIRIIYDLDTNNLIGINLMGVRFRHKVCEKWIADRTNIEDVLVSLKMAEFDPEFYDSYSFRLINLYNQQTGRNLTLRKKMNLNSVFRFLNSNIV